MLWHTQMVKRLLGALWIGPSVAAGCSGPDDPALYIWKLSWNTGKLWVASQVQMSSHSDLIEVWRQAAEFGETQAQITSHRQVAKPQRQRFQVIEIQVQIPSAQDVSKGLWEFSNVAGAQVPDLQQSIGIKAAATEHYVPVRIRIQDHEQLHQPLGCLLVPTFAKQVRNNW